jgi:hypothetical protein
MVFPSLGNILQAAFLTQSIYGSTQSLSFSGSFFLEQQLNNRFQKHDLRHKTIIP